MWPTVQDKVNTTCKIRYKTHSENSINASFAASDELKVSSLDFSNAATTEEVLPC